MIVEILSDLHFEAEEGSARNCAATSLLLMTADRAGPDGYVLVLGDVVNSSSAEEWAIACRVREDARTRCGNVFYFMGNHELSVGGFGPLDDVRIARAVTHADESDRDANYLRSVLWLDCFDAALPTSEGAYRDWHALAMEKYAPEIVLCHFNPLVTDGALKLVNGDRLIRDAIDCGAWCIASGHTDGDVLLQDATGRDLGDVARYVGELILANTDGCVAHRACVEIDTDERMAQIVHFGGQSG